MQNSFKKHKNAQYIENIMHFLISIIINDILILFCYTNYRRYYIDNTYKLKQVLFALRKEYIEVERKLWELEKYVNIIGDIDDISFKVHDFNDSKNIDMYLRKKQTIIDKIREVIGLPGIYTRGVAFWMVPEEIEEHITVKKIKFVLLQI